MASRRDHGAQRTPSRHFRISARSGPGTNVRRPARAGFFLVVPFTPGLTRPRSGGGPLAPPAGILELLSQKIEPSA